MTLSSPQIEVTVLPQVGARVHRILAFGHDVLRTPDDPAAHGGSETFFWGAYNMAPWCNRVSTGRLAVGKRMVDLPANFRDGTAIHGQVYAAPWETVGTGQWQIRGGGNGWPWEYLAALAVSVEGPTMRVVQSVRNLSTDRMPAGVGLHPWFAGRPSVAIRGDNVYPTNMDSPPLSRPVADEWDLRTLGQMKIGLDATWAEIHQPAVTIDWIDHGIRAQMTSNSATLHITAANPADLAAVAIEPQTHAPQALRRLLAGEPGALTWLDPEGVLSHTIEINFERYGG